MSHVNDCPECRAGMMRAALVPVGWTCSQHGQDQLYVHQFLTGIADLREQVAAAEAALAQAQEREKRLREALTFYADLNAYYDEYGHTDLAAGDAGSRARAALVGREK